MTLEDLKKEAPMTLDEAKRIVGLFAKDRAPGPILEEVRNLYEHLYVNGGTRDDEEGQRLLSLLPVRYAVRMLTEVICDASQDYSWSPRERDPRVALRGIRLLCDYGLQAFELPYDRDERAHPLIPSFNLVVEAETIVSEAEGVAAESPR